MTVERCSTLPDPGRRLGSGLARRSSPASKLKILPDRSLLAEGPAEVGTGLLGSAILAVTRSTMSSLSYSAWCRSPLAQSIYSASSHPNFAGRCVLPDSLLG